MTPPGSALALKISDNIYVDNVLLGANSVQNAYEIYLESKDIFKRASMNLREWISNCSEFLNLLPESDVVRGSIVKIFGIPWNYEEDYLQVSGFSSNQVDIPPTKRGVLKILAKIFDPLGLVTPVTFFGKVFLQELWKEGISWDELLSDNLCVKWKEIKLTQVKISVKVENIKICWIRESCKAIFTPCIL